ncbi:2-phospho-L-lactate guanylyltransferase [Xylanimonas allomyrinae]|uniref:Phosphoenolpyruvate guanylyltransferase n=1 Tax=Xylanimonas allomyrinae TaxID=2509459 RepID=A0A4P6EMM4_9MICO|nr:2-phospho-L-lactate guanylyltransferase [Xylanimonas allomyrinae]QAY63685.1 2-phospho-L-lactate guanylyltransferase [Xylanimonas allomyrinae]
MSGESVVAVVPLRDGVSGKSRLATGLTPSARRRVVTELARHVVGTLAGAAPIDGIVVVTTDPAFVTQTLAGVAETVLATSPARHGPPAPPRPASGHPVTVSVLDQRRGRPGLNAAVDLARGHVRAHAPAATLLVAHADLPSLAPDDVTALLAARTGPPAAPVVIATDRHGTGTNLLVLPAGAAFGFRFGAGSRAAHEAEAARRGLGAVVVRRPGTAADLDTLDDWADLPAPLRARLAGPGRTARP